MAEPDEPAARAPAAVNWDQVYREHRELLARVAELERFALGSTLLDVLRRLDRLSSESRTAREQLERLRETVMAHHQEYMDLLTRIDAATNEVAADLKALRDQLKDHMNPAEHADVKAKLTALADRLDALGKDEDDPVPPAPRRRP